jgi:formylglycine-generating enzyme required for sulfatase activity
VASGACAACSSLPGLEPKRTWTTFAIGLPLIAALAVVVYLAARQKPGGNGTTPSAPLPVTNPVPYCGTGMVGIAQGAATIGAEDDEADERPPHTVTLNAFCVDETEVTVAQYEECVKANTCAPLLATVEWADVKPADHTVWDGFCNGGKPDRASHPANCVTFDQANAFCKFKKKQLPSEEEWEYAARGDAEKIFPWGNDVPDEKRVNVCGTECVLHPGMLEHGASAMHKGNDGWDGTAPVGSYPTGRSAAGALDMAGNVAEWTQSKYCPYPGNNCSSDKRTTRGGSFASGASKEIHGSHRHKDAPNARSPLIGFRCAK